MEENLSEQQAALLQELVDDYSMYMRVFEQQLKEAYGKQDPLSGGVADLKMEDDEVAAWMGIDSNIAEARKLKKLRNMLTEQVAGLSEDEVTQWREERVQTRQFESNAPGSLEKMLSGILQNGSEDGMA